jgi:hypothetical protein
MNASLEPRRADRTERKGIRFSICTLVTDHGEYADMVASFRAGGFGGPDCEYLYLDNSQANAFDAFQGGNIFLREAAGDFIILCHQDIVLLTDDRQTLEARLQELDALDPNWALCGNGGGTSTGELIIRVSDPHGTNLAWGTFPTQVTALDENFIVVRADANLVLSHDLRGFHLSGADLCILADVLGCSAWVIDFHLLHKSPGRMDASFVAAKQAMKDKYQRAFRSRLITTTCTNLKLVGKGPGGFFARLFRR